MSARLEKCSECGRVYVRHSETGKFHPRYRAEQICYECAAELQRAEQGAALVSASIQSSGPSGCDGASPG